MSIPPRRRPPYWWKKPTGRVCAHGLMVVEVNGTFVRNHFDSDFDQGGNGFRYRFIPKGELWYASEVPKAERPYVVFHECYETEKMRAGKSYESAHQGAKILENRLRRRYRPGE